MSTRLLSPDHVRRSHLLRMGCTGRTGRVSARRQRGAIALLAAIWVSVALAALGALDVGNVYFARRDLQRVADLAAIAGVQQITDSSGVQSVTNGESVGGNCSSTAAQKAVQAAAANNAIVNGFTASVTNTITVNCGRWDSTAPSSLTSQTAPQNAVQVQLSRNVPFLFLGPSRTVTATGVAQATNVASFSLSTQAASVSGGVVNALLQQTLGAGINLQVADASALAGGQVQLLDLMQRLYAQGAISVLSVNSLLGSTMSVGTLISAMQMVLSNNGDAASISAATALGKIAAGLSGSPQVLISNILGVSLANPEAATSSYLNVLDLITSASLASGTSQIDLSLAFQQNSSSLLPGISLLSGSTIKLIVGTPPKTVIGEAGMNANGNWRTSVHTADIGLFADLKVSAMPASLASILPSSSPLTLELPLYVEGFTGTAQLVSTQCGTTASSSNMVISVSPGIAHAIISNDVKTLMSSSPSTAAYQAYMANPTYSQPASILTLSLGSVSALSSLLPASLSTVSLSIGSVPNGNGTPTQGWSLSVQPPDNSQSMTFTGAGSLNAFQPSSGQANSNQLGAAAGDSLAQLISGLTPPSPALYATLGSQSYPLSAFNLGSVLQAGLGPLGYLLNALLTPVLAPISSALTGITSLLLQPLLTALDTLIVPLLQLLGVQIGIATVHAISLQCGTAQLVNSQ